MPNDMSFRNYGGDSLSTVPSKSLPVKDWTTTRAERIALDEQRSQSTLMFIKNLVKELEPLCKESVLVWCDARRTEIDSLEKLHSELSQQEDSLNGQTKQEKDKLALLRNLREWSIALARVESNKPFCRTTLSVTCDEVGKNKVYVHYDLRVGAVLKPPLTTQYLPISLYPRIDGNQPNAYWQLRNCNKQAVEIGLQADENDYVTQFRCAAYGVEEKKEKAAECLRNWLTTHNRPVFPVYAY